MIGSKFYMKDAGERERERSNIYRNAFQNVGCIESPKVIVKMKT